MCAINLIFGSLQSLAESKDIHTANLQKLNILVLFLAQFLQLIDLWYLTALIKPVVKQ